MGAMRKELQRPSADAVGRKSGHSTRTTGRSVSCGATRPMRSNGGREHVKSTTPLQERLNSWTAKKVCIQRASPTKFWLEQHRHRRKTEHASKNPERGGTD